MYCVPLHLRHSHLSPDQGYIFIGLCTRPSSLGMRGRDEHRLVRNPETSLHMLPFSYPEKQLTVTMKLVVFLSNRINTTATDKEKASLSPTPLGLF